MLRPVAAQPSRFARQLSTKIALVALGIVLPAAAQQYSISTVAGGANPSTPVAATSISIGQPRRTAVDSKSNVYFSSGNSVFKLSGGTLFLVAGNSRAGFSGDGGPAVNAQLNAPQGMAIDSSGNVYIADTNNNRVRVVTTNGIINTFAGNGLIGSPLAFGDGGPANQANLQLPGGVALDSKGNLYIADTGDNLIREVTTDGIINSICGDSLPGFMGDGAAPLNAEVHSPEDVAVDSSGNIYIADTFNAAIREITLSNNQINTIAGNGSVGYSGDGGLATSAGLIEPYAISLDSKGNVFIAEPPDGRIRELTISNLFIITAVGNGVLGFSGDGGQAVKAEINQASGVAVDSSGNIYLADAFNNRIRKIDASGVITTIAGSGVYSYSGDGGPATSAQLFAPHAAAIDVNGNLFIADTDNNAVREVNSKGVISTIAGTGVAGSSGDNAAATAATLNLPQGVAVDASGNVFVADTANSRVRKISNGTITNYAGNGTAGYSGNGGSATGATLNTPVGLAVDKSGNLYIADQGNNVVRMVSAGGTISTFAGNGTQGYSGNGGPATSAQLNGPQGVAVDSSGNVFIADTLNSAIREVTPNGTIQTIAGTGIAGYSGDGGLAIAAQLGSPTSVGLDVAGNLFLTDSGTRIRKIFTSGIINTIAGTGALGYSGDNGPAASATFHGATGLAVDLKGEVFVPDSFNNAVRELTFTGSNLSISAITNGASNQTGPIAPGEVIVIYGTNIGPATLTTYQLTSGGQLSTSIGGTSVYVNGAPAPMLYASLYQVSAIVPFGVTGSAAYVFVENQGQTTAPVIANVTPTAPAVFTANLSGTGQAVAFNSDNSVNSAANPAKAGSIVTLFITGAGATNPPSTDGSLATVPLPLPVAQVTVAIGGKSATVNYAGASLGTVNGIIQVNATVPSGLPAGAASIIVQVGNTASQGNVTVAVSGN
jgi:trimeric autotransporter adhesin